MIHFEHAALADEMLGYAECWVSELINYDLQVDSGYIILMCLGGC